MIRKELWKEVSSFQEYEIKDYNAPLEEVFFNSLNYREFLCNEHFHHSAKGCQIEMSREYKGQIGDESPVVSKKCLTHGVNCSKTGWEWGWYLGTSSKELLGGHKCWKICKRCGAEYKSNCATSLYCLTCRPLAHNELNKLHSFRYDRKGHLRPEYKLIK